MGENIIRSLIGLVLLVGAIYVALWVIGLIGIALPSIITTLIWVAVILVAVLYIFRALGGNKLF